MCVYILQLVFECVFGLNEGLPLTPRRPFAGEIFGVS